MIPRRPRPQVVFSEGIVGPGRVLFEEVCQQGLEGFSRTLVPGGGLQEPFAERLPPEGREHVGERGPTLAAVPRPVRKGQVPMTVLDEPHHYEAVQEHGHRRGPGGARGEGYSDLRADVSKARGTHDRLARPS